MISLVGNPPVALAQGANNGAPTRLAFFPANDVVGVLCSNISCAEEKILGRTKLADLMDRAKKSSRLLHVIVNASGRLPAIIAYISALIIAGNSAVSTSAVDSPLGTVGVGVAATVCFLPSI